MIYALGRVALDTLLSMALSPSSSWGPTVYYELLDMGLYKINDKIQFYKYLT